MHVGAGVTGGTRLGVLERRRTRLTFARVPFAQQKREIVAVRAQVLIAGADRGAHPEWSFVSWARVRGARDPCGAW